MKKLIPILIFLIAGLTYAQDGYNQSEAYYNEVKAKLSNVDKDTFIQSEIDISENIEIKLNFVTTLEKSNSIIVIYQKDGEKLKYNSKIDDSNLVTWWNISKDGRYTLRKIQGTKDIIYEIWINFFLESATLENMENKYTYKVLQSKDKDIHIQVVERGGYYVIENRTKK